MNSERNVYLSGDLVPESQANISIFDSAVMLGDCVTESTRTFAHNPFKLDEHITRLYKSLKVARIDPGLSPAEMKTVTLELLQQNLQTIGQGEDFWVVHNISRGLAVAG
ncbi:MAG: branched-chain amino acid aminotransferase, partial [Planctomycetaceae bacterium]|nr:branched-chain amino acid aminotransferase [Planctomycetaceae bacterium]